LLHNSNFYIFKGIPRGIIRFQNKLYNTPNNIAPPRTRLRYKPKILKLNTDFIITRFDSLVDGPEIKKAKIAPFDIPIPAN
jgi:hypothetical protein